jgi:Ca2+-binding RTX toxin-like protein
VTLYYGTTEVAQFLLSGSFTHSRFLLLPDGNNGTDVMVAQGGGGGGGGGQGNTDLLAWATPGSGAWSKIADWYDVTTGSPALAPPGAENPVDLIGNTGTYQVIGGPGVCASIACFGNTLLNSDFTTGAFSVGGTLNGAATAASVDAGTSSGITATVASIDGGTLMVNGSGTTLSVSGTMALGVVNDGVLALSNHGTAHLGGLVLGGVADSTITADITSSIEIGLLGTGALGAITVDPGYVITGYGIVNPVATIVDNGTITAQGGTLDLGAVSGTGALSIAGEATLALNAGDACPIDFAGGGGGTLELAGSEETPTGVISGFAPGDLIVTGSSQVGSLTFTPGAGGVGTLTLYSGGSIAGTLLLSGNFSGDSFFLQPDGLGSAIGVQTQTGGPSPGTTTPDDYVWTGAVGTLWNTAGNWSDISAGQTIALIAPGSQDLDTVQGASGAAFTTIIGPADAASLTLLGNVSLDGDYSVGGLSMGLGAATGVLALGGGSIMQAASASVLGGVLVQAAAFSTSGTVSVTSGLLQATDMADLQAGALVLGGPGSIITTDATSIFEIGAAGNAVAGVVTVDQGAVLSGAGDVNPLGAISDQGTITASAGTLILGAVSGTGLLEIGVNAELSLAASTGGGLLIDFAGPGTLALPDMQPLAAITGFGDGDQILMPLTGITDAVYGATGPGIGVLTLSGNGQTLGQLTLAGVGAGQTFTATAVQGGTVLTTQTTTWGGGGSTVGNQGPTLGGGSYGVVQDFTWWQTLPSEVQAALAAFQIAAGSQESYIWTSPDGTGWGNAAPSFANFAVAQNPAPNSWINLPPGYEALLAQGAWPTTLTDDGQGGSLIVGNQGNDTIVAIGGNDTLVGGAGGNDVIYAANSNLGTAIYGGGNDTIVTGTGAAKIQTSLGGHSIVFLGAASNIAELGGADMVVAGSGPNANDTITASGADTVFGPSVGQITHVGGAGADLLVAGTGTFRAIGGSGNGGTFYAGRSAFAQYIGGGGSEVVVGGTGVLSVQGNAGAITVFGGSGATQIQGAPGPSQFVLGIGGATVTAAQGNDVWLASAANDSLVASGGNVILWAAGATGNTVFQAGDGPVTMHGGLGSDTFLGGAGSATMTGGGGNDIFSFTDGLTGGSNQITDFNVQNDTIQLHFYAGYTSSVVNGSEVLTLSDGTRIQLNGITSLTGVHISVG